MGKFVSYGLLSLHRFCNLDIGKNGFKSSSLTLKNAFKSKFLSKILLSGNYSDVFNIASHIASAF